MCVNGPMLHSSERQLYEGFIGAHCFRLPNWPGPALFFWKDGVLNAKSSESSHGWTVLLEVLVPPTPCAPVEKVRLDSARPAFLTAAQVVST